MAKRQAINVGPHERFVDRFSLAQVVGDMVFVSGHGPIDVETGRVQGQTIEEHTEWTLRNMRTVLAAAGCSLNDCVKITVHLADLADYSRFNAAYRPFFDPPLPARMVVQSGLLSGILVEMDAIAIKNSSEG